MTRSSGRISAVVLVVAYGPYPCNPDGRQVGVRLPLCPWRLRSQGWLLRVRRLRRRSAVYDVAVWWLPPMQDRRDLPIVVLPGWVP